MLRTRLLPRPFAPVAVVFFTAMATLGGPQNARAELHWTTRRKEAMRVRLVALEWNHQRASFFGSEEIFIAEKQLDRDEWRLVKLIYGFLPYQPRLSEAGLDYSTVYEVRATRDPSCDETLAKLTSGKEGDWRQTQPDLKYSADAPPLNLQRSKSMLPCYVTGPEDYSRAIEEPAGTAEPRRPKLQTR